MPTMHFENSMKRSFIFALALAGAGTLAAAGTPGSLRAQDMSVQTIKPGRAPNQPIDAEYTRKIHEYTTEPFFLSPLVDYLPASKTVPTPAAVLGRPNCRTPARSTSTCGCWPRPRRA